MVQVLVTGQLINSYANEEEDHSDSPFQRARSDQSGSSGEGKYKLRQNEEGNRSKGLGLTLKLLPLSALAL